MRQSRARVEDARFERERRSKYRGRARLSLDVLQSVPGEDGTLDTENVERLKKKFQREGCRPEFVDNHILVTIDQDCLDTALSLSRLSAASLFTNTTADGTVAGNYHELRFPAGVRLHCLQGKHRIQAGREFLSPRDKWWIADLYLSSKCTILGG